MLSTQQQPRHDDQHTGPDTPTEHQTAKRAPCIPNASQCQPNPVAIHSNETKTLSHTTRTLEVAPDTSLKDDGFQNEKLPTLQTSLSTFNQIPVYKGFGPKDPFSSMDQLKETNSNLLPPFKSVQVPNSKQSVNGPGDYSLKRKLYSESQTFVLTNRGDLEGQVSHSTNGIREIISRTSELPAPVRIQMERGYKKEERDPEMDSTEGLAAPFVRRQVEHGKPFLSFQISELQPRDSQGTTVQQLQQILQSQLGDPSTVAPVLQSGEASVSFKKMSGSKTESLGEQEEEQAKGEMEKECFKGEEEEGSSQYFDITQVGNQQEVAEQRRCKREQLNQLAAQSYFGPKEPLPRTMSMDTNVRKPQRKRKRLAKGADEELDAEKLQIATATPQIIIEDIQLDQPMSAQPSKACSKASKKSESRCDASEQPIQESSMKATGRWTQEEHFRFLEALKKYGKEWKRVQQHVGTRSSTQARSHAQKFFVKLEKKKVTMEEFLGKLDMTNLKTMIENDSDYGEEDLEVVNDVVSSSAHSIQHSQSAKSNIKSPKKSYKKPSFLVQQSRQCALPKPVVNNDSDQEPDLSLQDHSESNHSRQGQQKDFAGSFTDQNAALSSLPDKSPGKPISEQGQVLTTHSTAATHLPDSNSTQFTPQTVVQKVTHKTPQMKPSVPGLAMEQQSIPETYSNDDKPQKETQFALPLVGKRRKASEAGMSRPNHQNKRQHQQNSHKKEAREAEIVPLEMKKTKSLAFPVAGDKPFTNLFQQPQQFQDFQQQQNYPQYLASQSQQIQLFQMLQKQHTPLHGFGMDGVNFVLPMGQTTTTLPPQMFEENGRDPEQQQANLMRHNSFSYPMHEIRNPYELGQGMMLQNAQNVAISQTPRLKAKTFSSPILNGFDQQPAKRAISVLDQEYDLRGLSQKNVLDDDSFMMGNLNSFAPIDDLNHDNTNLETGMKLPPFQNSGLEHDFLSQDPLQIENNGPFSELPPYNTVGLGGRNRSMTFHLPSQIHNMLLPQGSENNPRIVFDDEQHNS